MLSRSRLALSLCGLALAVPALPARTLADDGQPAAASQPAVNLESASSVTPSAGYQPTAGAQPALGLPTAAGYSPTASYPPPAGYAPTMNHGPYGAYPPGPGSPPASVFQPLSNAAVGASQPAPAKHHHNGLFGWRHCVECQRARVKAHDGVDIPPPPSPAGMVYQGQAIASGPVVMSGSEEAGYAVVGPGGPGDGTGYAVVGGASPSAEPAPIGLARNATTPWADPRMAAMPHRPGAGPYDPSVVPSGLPAAPTAIPSAGHDRPHIISHILHIPRFGTHRQEREDRQRQKHASIAYGDQSQKVMELPASMVYGKGNGR